jgi:hypothetical protein
VCSLCTLDPSASPTPSHLPQHGVAASHVVLGDLVDGGDSAKVVAHVVTRLHGNDILKLNQGTLSVARMAYGYMMFDRFCTCLLERLAFDACCNARFVRVVTPLLYNIYVATHAFPP